MTMPLSTKFHRIFSILFPIFRYHFDALAEANDAQNAQDHIIDRIESLPLNTLNVQR